MKAKRAFKTVAPAEWQRRRPWWPEIMLEVARHYLYDNLSLGASDAAEVRVSDPYYEAGDPQARFPRFGIEARSQSAVLEVGRAIRDSRAEIDLETWEPVVNAGRTTWFTTATVYPIPQSYRVRVGDVLVRSHLGRLLDVAAERIAFDWKDGSYTVVLRPVSAEERARLLAEPSRAGSAPPALTAR